MYRPPENVKQPALVHNRQKTRESSEIKKPNWRKITVSNFGEGNLVNISVLTLIFAKFIEKETNTKTWCEINKQVFLCISSTFENGFD